MVKDDLSLYSTPGTPWTAASSPRHIRVCADHCGDREGLPLHAPPKPSWQPLPVLATASASFTEEPFPSRNSRH